MKERESLLRIVRTEEGFSVDRTETCGGRGAWICKDGACIDALLKKHGLDRSFKCRVSESSYEALAEELRKEL